MFGKKKGEYGYIASRRLWSIIRTIVYFGISAAIYAIGYLTTHTQANLLTVVAVLGVLPSAKSAVSVVMYLKARPCSQGLYERSLGWSGIAEGSCYYDIYLTTYDRNYAISLAVPGEGRFLALSEDANLKDKDLKEGEAHIQRVLALDNIRDVNIRLLNNEDEFKRLLERSGAGADSDAAQAIIRSVMGVAL